MATGSTPPLPLDALQLKRRLVLQGGGGFAVLPQVCPMTPSLASDPGVGAGQWIGCRLSEQLLYRLSGGLFIAFGLFSLQQALS